MASKSKTVSIADAKAIFEREILIGAKDDDLKEGTVALYVRQLSKIYKEAQEKYKWSFDELLHAIREPNPMDDREFSKVYHVKKSDIVALVFETYTNKESQLATLNAICKSVKNRYHDAFGYYNLVRRVVSRRNKDEKMNNELTPEEMEKYISYDELIAVPQKIHDFIVKAYGQLYRSRDVIDKMGKKDRTDYLRSVFDYITVYLNVHYPLRLVWPTVLLKPVEGANYLSGNKLYLNDFKNVRLMGPQVVELDEPAMKLINSYLAFLRKSLGERPEKLLYRIYNGNVAPYDYSSNRTGGFSQIISKLFLKYNGKAMSMNMIRHIVESHIIQHPSYAHLSNRTKNQLHGQLLHSFYAANMSYNKIANTQRAQEAKAAEDDQSDHGYEPQANEDDQEPAQVRMAGNRARRRERIFHGEIPPRDGQRGLEVDIFES
jgi:hypothetical protein